MRTIKNCSSISYLPPEIFRVRVEKVAKQIAPVLWIAHKGEEDENGKRDKDHIHFVLIGGVKGIIDTERVVGLLGSAVLPNGETASTCEVFKITKRVEDWFLYGIHHPSYLLRKGFDEKQYRYEYDDVKCTDGFAGDLARIVRASREYLAGMTKTLFRRVIDRAFDRYPTFDAFLASEDNIISPTLYNSARVLWNAKKIQRKQEAVRDRVKTQGELRLVSAGQAELDDARRRLGLNA